MTIEQVQFIVNQHRFPGIQTSAKIVETHISWIILTDEFAFKIKKPVQFPFLDFSTLEKRAYYCQEEIRLNRRLAPQMYLQVLPIGLSSDGNPEICAQYNAPVDFAVQMKRMDDSRQMDRLMLQNAVGKRDMVALAQLLAPFHQSVRMRGPETHYAAETNKNDFEDLFQLQGECSGIFGPEANSILQDWRLTINTFLKLHEPRLAARAKAGFWVEGHGDLHGRNIFLFPEGPVVFDCIEFNPHFRQLDVLSELAFLCMDIEANGRADLEKEFINAYLSLWLCIENAEDERLFRYFKAYRANVRLKITLLEWQQHASEKLEETAFVYWNLLLKYMAHLSSDRLEN